MDSPALASPPSIAHQEGSARSNLEVSLCQQHVRMQHEDFTVHLHHPPHHGYHSKEIARKCCSEAKRVHKQFFWAAATCKRTFRWFGERGEHWESVEEKEGEMAQVASSGPPRRRVPPVQGVPLGIPLADAPRMHRPRWFLLCWRRCHEVRGEAKHARQLLGQSQRWRVLRP